MLVLVLSLSVCPGFFRPGPVIVPARSLLHSPLLGFVAPIPFFSWIRQVSTPYDTLETIYIYIYIARISDEDHWNIQERCNVEANYWGSADWQLGPSEANEHTGRMEHDTGSKGHNNVNLSWKWEGVGNEPRVSFREDWVLTSGACYWEHLGIGLWVGIGIGLWVSRSVTKHTMYHLFLRWTKRESIDD